MEYSKMNAFKSFVLRHRKVVVFSLCSIVALTILFVFGDSYAKRFENNDFSELKTYMLEIFEKDRGIFNNLKVKEVEKEVYGIDVSSWQKDIDWEKVKESGIDFVMLRCGYRNLSNEEIHEDSTFKYNISEANRLGIPVGVYFYSTAISEKEALEEASFVLHMIKDYDVTYPIVYDFELFNERRTEGISALKINDNALTFLNYLEKHGYKGVIYSNLSYLDRVWDIERFDDYKFWLAQYDGEVETEYDMIQYSNKGKIDGISTNVDLNKSKVAYVVEK